MHNDTSFIHVGVNSFSVVPSVLMGNKFSHSVIWHVRRVMEHNEQSMTCFLQKGAKGISFNNVGPYTFVYGPALVAEHNNMGTDR